MPNLEITIATGSLNYIREILTIIQTVNTTVAKNKKIKRKHGKHILTFVAFSTTSSGSPLAPTLNPNLFPHSILSVCVRVYLRPQEHLNPINLLSLLGFSKVRAVHAGGKLEMNNSG